MKVIAETVDEQGWSCTVYFGQDDEARDAMRAFSDQLRTGQLVAVSDDAIERVKAVIRDAMMSSDYPASEWETDLAKATIAAMKDTQP